MSEALAIIGVICACTGIASWFAILIYGIKAARRPSPAALILRQKFLWNPANVLVFPGLLTDEGKKYRRRCFIAVVIFAISIGLPFFLASLIGERYPVPDTAKHMICSDCGSRDIAVRPNWPAVGVVAHH